MFKGRKNTDFKHKFRNFLWPVMGLKRFTRYLYLRTLRLTHNPDALAKGVACGLCVSFFPVFGIHMVMAGAFALMIRASVWAAILGTLLIPPFAIPFVFSLDFVLGRKILRSFGISQWGSEEHFQRATTNGFTYVVEHFEALFIPALTGGIIFMLLVWPTAYMASHKVIDYLVERHAKRKKLREQA